MKNFAALAFITLTLSTCAGPSLANAESVDPCGNKKSNMEMRECYAKEQARVNLEADLLANKIAANLRNEAEDPVGKGVVADLLRKGVSAVTRSQTTWKAYRDQHCRAAEYVWTTGSGAGTAYEACMLDSDKHDWWNCGRHLIRSCTILPLCV